VILAAAESCEPGRLRYAPDEQEWLEGAGFWVGRWKAEIIGPADLIRRKPLDGHFLELADGAEWLCPVARSHVIEGGAVRWRHKLPRRVGLGADRKWLPGEVLPRYRRLWDLALAWWDARLVSAQANANVGETIRFDFDGLYGAAAECLAANYRLGPDEISMLGLFDSDSARKILDALIDLPTITALREELEKKTASPPADG
jgi:hypothetical protein